MATLLLKTESIWRAIPRKPGALCTQARGRSCSRTVGCLLRHWFPRRCYRAAMKPKVAARMPIALAEGSAPKANAVSGPPPGLRRRQLRPPAGLHRCLRRAPWSHPRRPRAAAQGPRGLPREGSVHRPTGRGPLPMPLHPVLLHPAQHPPAPRHPVLPEVPARPLQEAAAPVVHRRRGQRVETARSPARKCVTVPRWDPKPASPAVLAGARWRVRQVVPRLM